MMGGEAVLPAAGGQEFVLVVENDQAIYELLADNLQRAGFAVCRAQDAKQAFELLQVNLPILVIIDRSLPGISGMQLLHRIRAESRFRRLPLLMLAGRSADVDCIAALHAGADDYVIKPFSPRELIARIFCILRGFAVGDCSAAFQRRLTT